MAGAARLVDVFTSDTSGGAFGTTSYPDFVDLKARNAVFDDVIGYSPMFGALNLGDRSRLTLGEIVTGNYFRTLGVGAALGRTLVPADDGPDAPRVAMVSYRYWTRELGGSADVVGRTLTMRGNAYTIVGVTPRGFSGMLPVMAPELWVPIRSAMEVEPIGMHDVVPSPTGTARLDRRGDRWLFVRGRLRPGVSPEQAGANLELLMSQLARAHPATNEKRHVAVKRTSAVHFHPAADAAIVPVAAGLMVAVGLVLLIACANVASMLLARASGRQREIGIRLALGASRGRLIRQLVTESVVLSALGAAAGVTFASWILRVAGSISLPIPVPMEFDLSIDARALAFTIVVTLVAGVVAGLAPAVKASRANLTSELRGDMMVSQTGGWRWSMRDALVVVQMAVTALLLVVAALLTRSLVAATKANVGFQVDRLAVISMDASMLRYSDDRARQFFDQAVARIGAIPGVESVGLSTRVPFSLNYNRWEIWVPDRHPPGEHGEAIDVTTVSPAYFKTIGVPIVEGRGFTEDDRPGTALVAVVNETMAHRFWPGESAIGRTFRSRGSDGPPFEIIGVAADHKVTSIGEPPTPFFHVALRQRPNVYSSIIARTRGSATVLLRDMQRELLALDSNLVFVENQTMAAEVAATLFPVRASAWIVGAVGLVAMALAAIGLYGVIAYSVARRTREIGIRMALGAHPAAVLGLVMRQGLSVALIGLVAGCLLAVAGARAIAGALYGIGAADPVSWASAAGVLLAVSAIANFIPARRAARVHPSEALRTE